MIKKLFRFSKAVTIFCIVSNTAITVTLFILLFKGIVLDGTVVMAMYAPFAIELGFNATIAIAKTKQPNTEESTNE